MLRRFAEECGTGLADEQVVEGATGWRLRRRRWGEIRTATSAVLAAGPTAMSQIQKMMAQATAITAAMTIA